MGKKVKGAQVLHAYIGFLLDRSPQSFKSIHKPHGLAAPSMAQNMSHGPKHDTQKKARYHKDGLGSYPRVHQPNLINGYCLSSQKVYHSIPHNLFERSQHSEKGCFSNSGLWIQEQPWRSPRPGKEASYEGHIEKRVTECH